VFQSGNADVPVVSWEDTVHAIQDLMDESDDRVAANTLRQSIRPRFLHPVELLKSSTTSLSRRTLQ
jgi:hypothetical protein